jgi:acetoin utilization protein AcuB
MVGAIRPLMLMPQVKRYMTHEPYSIESTDSLIRAKTLMRNHMIRHLPVIDGGMLVGIVSERDVSVVEAVPGTDLAHIETARVMEPAIYVWSETPIDEVSELMAKEKRDCVVVKGGNGVEGIFTATNALEALADLIRRATA